MHWLRRSLSGENDLLNSKQTVQYAVHAVGSTHQQLHAASPAAAGDPETYSGLRKRHVKRDNRKEKRLGVGYRSLHSRLVSSQYAPVVNLHFTYDATMNNDDNNGSTKTFTTAVNSVATEKIFAAWEVHLVVDHRKYLLWVDCFGFWEIFTV